MALVAAALAAADTFVVTKRGDPAPGELQAARLLAARGVIAATTPGRDVIELPNRRKPYTLTQTG